MVPVPDNELTTLCGWELIDAGGVVMVAVRVSTLLWERARVLGEVNQALSVLARQSHHRARLGAVG